MVFFRAHLWTHYLRFILARNYKGFVVDMDSLYQAHLHFSKELHWFSSGPTSGPTILGSFQQGIIRVSWWTWILLVKQTFILARTYNVFVVDMDSVRPSDRSRIGAKSASSPPRAKSAPRGSKSTTFAKGIFQLFNLRKNATNPMGDPSVLLIQSPIYL